MNCIQRPVAHRIADCLSFIPVAVGVMKWGELGGATVVDLGCQTGHSSHFLVEHYPNIKQVIAVDLKSKENVNQATLKKSHPKIKYEWGNVEDRKSLWELLGEQRKVISLNGFTHLSDQREREGFGMLFLLLEAGGEAAIYHSIKSPYTDFINEIRRSTRWAGIAEKMSLEIIRTHGTLGYYRQMFKDIGFTRVQCFHKKEVFTFSSDQDCKEMVFATLSEIMEIPEERKQELKEDAHRIFLNYSQRDNENNLTMVICKMYAFLKKPEAKMV